MESYIVELEQDILNNKDIKLILNKSLIISNQLEMTEFNDWINFELKGYENDLDKVPDYRILECEVRADGIQQTFGGILSVSNSPINDLPDEIDDLLRNVYVFQPISEIINICMSDLDQVRFKPDPHVENSIKEFVPNATEIYRVCPVFRLEAIIDQVKYELLKWCSELKKRDIIGESYIFTPEEREVAKTINYIVLNNSNVQIGSHNVNVSNNNVYGEIKLNLSEIKNILQNNEINEKIYNGIYSNCEIIEKELEKDNINKKNIERLLYIMKNFAGQIASSIIASEIINHIDIIFSLISGIPFS